MTYMLIHLQTLVYGWAKLENMFLLFGTRRRVNMLHGKLALKFGPFEINSTDNYKYLESVINQSLNLI